jgi:hypothetical protein
LDNWSRGRYPRNAVTGAVRELDAWALENAPGYPEAAGAPRLVETCGPVHTTPADEPPPAEASEDTAATEVAPARPWWRRRRMAAAAALLVLAAAGTTAFALRQDEPEPIPPDTTVDVRCRYYAPSIPSVTPDGFWYLIESDRWAGRWSPANSFMNGDVKGGPYVHNTDFDLPVCR